MKWVKGKYLFKVNYKDTIDIVLEFLLLKLDRYLSTESEVMMHFLIFFFCLKKKLDLIFFAFALRWKEFGENYILLDAFNCAFE